ncbi:MAG: efflux RND transporter permease subunit [Gammaproteobacteria bacterium]|nr:efflux RND transporter permease subunit [Gammaproteobacteria bacterium]
MWLSDTSVKRPVFATVISLSLLAFGVLSFNLLPLREYPDVTPPVISISTSYPGASSDVVESRVTTVIEDQISGIEGMVAMRSSSTDGGSRINLEFDLDRDIDAAANDVRDRVSRVVRWLPEDVRPPEVRKQDSDARPAMYINVVSSVLNRMELTDYTERYIADRFAAIGGVADAGVYGARPAMRIWVDRLALAARNLTVTDIESALRRENLELPAGRIETVDRELTVRVARGYESAEDFRELVVVRGEDGHLVRLGEVATVEVAPMDHRSIYRANGLPTVSIGIIKQSKANTLETLEQVGAEIEKVNEAIPDHMRVTTGSDDSVFIRAAINSVYRTIAITTVLVSLVILVFLGSFRTMAIPAVTIPVCLVSAFIALAAFGFTVNLITLLALVLSIGLVVDDAIVVLENIHRRIEEGETPLVAAYNGTRQVGFAVIATTAVLVAVFTPIMFLTDNIGVIFGELAVTIAAAVVFSSVLALSLTPVMCSKFLRASGRENRLTQWIDGGFSRLRRGYISTLRVLIRHGWVAVLAAAGTLATAYFLLDAVPREYVPEEDQGAFMAMFSGPEGMGIERMKGEALKLEVPARQMIDEGLAQVVVMAVPGWGGNASNSGVIMVVMKPWGEREISTRDAAARINAEWQNIPDVRAFAFVRSGLSRMGGGQPVQFVLGGPDYETLAEWRDLIFERAREFPGLQRVDSDLKETQPQAVVRIDKNRAAALGVSVQNIGRTLSTMMSEQRITTYVKDGEEYDVILQARDDQRASAHDLSNIYVRSDTGELIPLANLIRVDERAAPGSLNRYNRLRAVTITASLAPGAVLGDALEFLERVVRESFSDQARVDYQGESLEYKESSGRAMFTFGLALLIVFLVLAAQFESFVHPFVILVTVPLAVAGALLGLYLTGLSINIFSQIGIIMLIGIAAKNGVLIVEFINQMRDAGRSFEEAIIEASGIRLRPVVMTTISTVMGSIPLILATGAGSESRTVLGIVVFSGVSLATFLTLFIVPSFYALLARRTGSPQSVARRLTSLLARKDATA